MFNDELWFVLISGILLSDRQLCVRSPRPDSHLFLLQTAVDSTNSRVWQKNYTAINTLCVFTGLWGNKQTPDICAVFQNLHHLALCGLNITNMIHLQSYTVWKVLLLSVTQMFACAKSLFISDQDKRKHFCLLLRLFLGNRQEVGSFQSRMIKVISKPSQKRQSMKNADRESAWFVCVVVFLGILWLKYADLHSCWEFDEKVGLSCLHRVQTPEGSRTFNLFYIL